ncbi:hypothetical protein [Streptococcus castoreus]
MDYYFHSLVLCRALTANFAVAMAVGVKSKNNNNKQVGFSTLIAALVRVTEPALYGYLVRFRRPLVASCLAAAITGVFF